LRNTEQHNGLVM